MSTRQKIADYLEEAAFLDPKDFDDAIIGIASRVVMPDVVAYDSRRCIEIIKTLSTGMSIEEAEEYFEFNTIGCWMGETTPVWVDLRWAE